MTANRYRHVFDAIPVDALAAIAYALDLTLSELLLGIDALTPKAARLGGGVAAFAIVAK
jgi:hypothetical protein